MCGIAGFQGEFNAQLLERMGECIARRGPDGSGSAVLIGGSARTGLVHLRLVGVRGKPPASVSPTKSSIHAIAPAEF